MAIGQRQRWRDLEGGANVLLGELDPPDAGSKIGKIVEMGVERALRGCVRIGTVEVDRAVLYQERRPGPVESDYSFERVELLERRRRRAFGEHLHRFRARQRDCRDSLAQGRVIAEPRHHDLLHAIAGERNAIIG